jgi:hypothetical protein
MPEQPTTAPDTTPDTTSPTTPDSTPDATSTMPAHQATAEAESKSKRKKILSAIGTVAVVLLAKFGLGYMLSDKPAADTLSIGQCVQRGDDDSIAAVDCGDANADYKVVFIKKDTVEAQADQTCSPYKATTMTYFESLEGEATGNTVCLGAVR